MMRIYIAPILCMIFFSHIVYGKEILKILSWHGYTDTDIVSIFENKNNIDIEVTYVNNDKQLREKLDDRNQDYDLVALNSSELQRYIKLRKFVPIDIYKIENSKWISNQFAPLSTNPEITFNGNIYGLPYTYSSMGIIYNVDRVKSAPTSWQDFWSPEYHHKALGYDGGTHNVSLAALALKLPDPFQIPKSDDELIAKKLISLRENTLTFYRSLEEATELFNRFELSIMFANFGHQQVDSLKKTGANIEYTIPKEGALAWLDCWSILSTSKQTELAHRWIDFVLEPWVQLELTKRHGLQSPLNQFSESDNKEKLIWLSPVESPEKREAMWDSVYSGKPLPKVMEHTKRARQ
ncbi:Putrescine-binding periplasmic protein precursor [Vibrio mediterranei]|uniref:Spermidine/putrescine ABC transporter substrate-binding protein n=1 Tax=Vibrio mediterranei TaxID=689 RepID=A0ABX5D6S1_9VIBR|nr:extracellular solute-binding protein [Vibrio mediterranei]MCG9661790.1 extracellular solute-binding protein [Vibrio mediterranei]PCD85776.1 spermidine/putrescine ABC transporter substrate-binding protein [Vibrio mediterranei]PRQ65287.1 spermidine/putrescine ABC transporter substrate-binding protein [Vibrio mediterranei]SBO11883.1 Putrescine-binding periplasmic protein precursor [Vibrio mediterranei]